MNAQEHGAAPESRYIQSPREKIKIMMEVISKSFKSLTHAFLDILTGGKLNVWADAPEKAHGH